MSVQTHNAVEHLPASLQKLVRLVEEKKEGITPQLARDFVVEADVQTNDVLPWADFGHPTRDGYGRKMVYHGGFFEIMVMSWVPGDFSSIHDHGTAQWGAVKSFGNAEHAVFDIVEGTLTTRVRSPFGPGTVNPVTHDLIHQMGNVDQAPFCSLHMYGSYDHEGEITGDSRIFDLFENSIQYTTGGVFFCLPESDISGRDQGIPADLPTRVRHHAEMLRRVKRFLPFTQGEDRERFESLARELTSELLSEQDNREYQAAMANLLDAEGRIKDVKKWHHLWNELRVAANVKAEMQLAGH